MPTYIDEDRAFEDGEARDQDEADRCQPRAARLYRDRAPQFDRHRTHATERDSITAEAGWLIAAGMLVMTALYVVGFVS